MTLRLEEIVVDCRDHVALAAWWQQALGWPIVGVDDDGTELRGSDAGPSLMFVAVPERKTVKNRLHLDWIPDDQDAEVARLLSLGASRVDDGDFSWVVLADPEGNEFCVLSARPE